MSADTAEHALAPELEAVATAAERQLRALASEEPANADHLGQALADAATAAIALGHPIAAVADAEQRGQQRARAALSRELLTRVERAARRRREAEHDLHQAIARAARLGLAHRDIAAAAHVAHGTIRAILTRANGDTTPAPPEPEETPPASQGTDTPLPSWRSPRPLASSQPTVRQTTHRPAWIALIHMPARRSPTPSALDLARQLWQYRARLIEKGTLDAEGDTLSSAVPGMAAYTLLRSAASAARKLLEWGEPPAQLAIRPITPRPRPSTATSRKRRK
jgi:hypothetical protein